MSDILPQGQVVSLLQSVSNEALIGIIVGDINDVTTWQPVYKPTANTIEIQAVQNVLSTYNANINLGKTERRLIFTGATAITANRTFVVPAGYGIGSIDIKETANHAVTGGINLGTTNGGAQVISALAIPALSIPLVTDAKILQRVFSLVADTTLFLNAVTSWNSASLSACVYLRRVIP